MWYLAREHVCQTLLKPVGSRMGCRRLSLGEPGSNEQVDYSLATYMMGNEGAEDLVVTGHHYDVQPYYSGTESPPVARVVRHIETR